MLLVFSRVSDVIHQQHHSVSPATKALINRIRVLTGLRLMLKRVLYGTTLEVVNTQLEHNKKVDFVFAYKSIAFFL